MNKNVFFLTFYHDCPLFCQWRKGWVGSGTRKRWIVYNRAVQLLSGWMGWPPSSSPCREHEWGHIPHRLHSTWVPTLPHCMPRSQHPCCSTWLHGLPPSLLQQPHVDAPPHTTAPRSTSPWVPCTVLSCATLSPGVGAEWGSWKGDPRDSCCCCNQGNMGSWGRAEACRLHLTPYRLHKAQKPPLEQPWFTTSFPW